MENKDIIYESKQNINKLLSELKPSNTCEDTELGFLLMLQNFVDVSKKICEEHGTITILEHQEKCIHNHIEKFNFGDICTDCNKQFI